MFSLEKCFEIWNDNTGECIEVGPDRDGLDLVEIRYRNYDNEIVSRIDMPREQAALVGQALIEASKEK